MNDQINLQGVSEKIAIGGVIREAWYFVRGIKWPFFWMAIVFPLLLPCIFVLIFLYMPRTLFIYHPAIFFPLFKLIYAITLWYLFAILITLGVRQTIGMPIVIPLAFSDCMRVKGKLFFLFLLLFSVFEITNFINGITISTGLIGIFTQVIIFLPFVYLSLLVITFALPLIVFKRYDIQYALISAYNMMNKYWLKVTICYLILCIINLICTLPPLEIAMLWTVPMFFTMIGVLFKNASITNHK